MAKKIKFNHVCKKIAAQEGISDKEVKSEMTKAIEAAFKNPTKEQKLFQDTIPRKGNIPTYEEIMQFIVENIK